MNTEFDELPQADDDTPDPAAEAATRGDDPAAHLDTFAAPEIDGEGEAAPDDVQPLGDDGEPIAAAPEQITKAQFWEVFKQVFGLPGLFAPIWKPLAIQPDEIEAARAASDAIYEIAEIYLPSLLRPGGDMAARLLACVPFILAKGQIARAIIAEQKAQRLAANGSAQPRGNPAPEFTTTRADPRDDLRAMMDEGGAE